MTLAILLAVLAVPVVLLLRRRSRRRSGVREIVYNIEPIPGRIRKPRKGHRL